MLLSINWRNEVKKRISTIDAIKENLIDAKSELGEVKKRDPMCKTKSQAESGTANSGGMKIHPAIILSKKEELLQSQILEYQTIVNDFNKGWRTLDDDQKQVLDLRYKKNSTQEQVAKIMGYDARTIRRIESEALRLMEVHMLKY